MMEGPVEKERAGENARRREGAGEEGAGRRKNE
jgi:hypothetical protein